MRVTASMRVDDFANRFGMCIILVIRLRIDDFVSFYVPGGFDVTSNEQVLFSTVC